MKTGCANLARGKRKYRGGVCGGSFWILFEHVLCGDAVLINGLLDSGAAACPGRLEYRLRSIAQIISRMESSIQSEKSEKALDCESRVGTSAGAGRNRDLRSFRLQRKRRSQRQHRWQRCP